MKKLSLLFVVLCTSLTLAENPLRIAFGGCNKQRKNQEHWKVMGSLSPHAWIWNGDNIYADGMDPEERKAEYDYLKNNPFYAEFIRNVPVFGTWDDHDYASNDQGKEADFKRESQKLLLDFLGEPLDSARRKQTGVYWTALIGTAPHLVKVLLLDLRYFRDEPGEEAELLGSAQWKWLERELATTPSDIPIVIVSSSQALTSDAMGESWEQYPTEKEKLLAQIDKAKAPVLFVSGDRHMGEISRQATPGGKELYDITSSGLTHSNSGIVPPNVRRVGKTVMDKNFGLLEFEWKEKVVEVHAKIYDTKGNRRHGVKLSFAPRS